MIKFIRKIILLSLPVILVLSGMEVLIRSIPNDYSYKRNYMDLHAGEIEVLILGNSHAYNGVDPECFSHSAFNLSHVSQTFDLDLALYKKWADSCSNLRIILLPADYFSFFSTLSTGREPWRMKNYALYYKLPGARLQDYSELLSVNFKKSINRIVDYYLKNKNPLSCTVLGYGNKEQFNIDLKESAIRAAKRHTRNNLKEHIAYDYLKQLVELADEHGVKVLIYTSPATSFYQLSVKQEQMALSEALSYRMVREHDNVSYKSFFSNETLTNEHFSDGDHLNRAGTQLFSDMLNDEVLKILK